MDLKTLAEIIKADGWLYFAIGFCPPMAQYLMSDQAFSSRMLIGVLFASFGGGFIALKAFRSKNREDIERIGMLQEKLDTQQIKMDSKIRTERTGI